MEVFPLALAPSLLWLWWFWRQEPKGRRESARPLAKAFIAGAVITIPAGLVSWMLGTLMPDSQNIWRYFIVVGPIEEIAKYWAACWAVKKEPTYDEHSDGIVFAAATALGFAFVENIFYFAGATPKTMITRSLLAVPGHVLDAVWWGEAMGRLKFVAGTPRSVIFNGLILASLMHGLYDAIVFSGSSVDPTITLVLFFGLLILQWRLFGQLLRRALFTQPHSASTPVSVHSTTVTETTTLSVTSIVPEIEAPEAKINSIEVTETSSVETTKITAGLTKTPKNRGPEKKKFDWSYMYRSICFTLPTLVPIALACSQCKGVGDFVFLLAMSCIVSIGFMIGVWSPGCTIKEVAIGIAIVGAAAGSISWYQSIASAVTLGILGAFGAWLGEALQDRTRRCLHEGEHPSPPG